MVVLIVLCVLVMGLVMECLQIMGIVNVIFDSFFDGGVYDGLDYVCRLIVKGVVIVDIGGEFIWFGVLEVVLFDEIVCIILVIKGVRGQVVILVDMCKVDVVCVVVVVGVGLVNDVLGLDYDLGMVVVVVQMGVVLCIMYVQGVLEIMQDNFSYGDVLLDVYDVIKLWIDCVMVVGILCNCIVIDLGIGFGKLQVYNLVILWWILVYYGLGCVVLLGVLCKCFIGVIGGVECVVDCVVGMLVVILVGVVQGIQIYCVYDVVDIR